MKLNIRNSLWRGWGWNKTERLEKISKTNRWGGPIIRDLRPQSKIMMDSHYKRNDDDNNELLLQNGGPTENFRPYFQQEPLAHHCKPPTCCKQVIFSSVIIKGAVKINNVIG